MILLVKHIYSQSTQKGAGNIHDHILILEAIGKGRYGVVRLGQMIVCVVVVDDDDVLMNYSP